MQKFITYSLIIMLVLVGFISCENDDGLKNVQQQGELILNTVSPTEVASAFKASNTNKSAQNWITPYFQYNDSISVINSTAQITVTPAITTILNTYSRLFTIDINGELKTVVYNMFPSAQSTNTSFYGGVMVSELNGDIISAFEIEDNNFTAYYDVVNHYETLSILNLINKNGGESKNGCPEDDPDCLDFNGGELDEVVVTAPPNDGLSIDIIIIFVPELFPDDEQDGGIGTIPDDTTPEPTAPAGNTNDNSCPPGKIKDENGNCIDSPVECPDENMIQNDVGNCVCKIGYIENKDGSCVKKPCENDPVVNPKVAAQKLSGVNGGRYGCTRLGSGCPSQLSKKSHRGLDVSNSYGSPIFAMYDGTATAISTYYKNAGWIAYQTATVNGETISIQYFHLQKENRASGTISAGDIIEYQGNSGNLAGALNKKTTESHVHIKIKDSDGNTLDPENFMANINTTPDSQPDIINNDCN